MIKREPEDFKFPVSLGPLLALGIGFIFAVALGIAAIILFIPDTPTIKKEMHIKPQKPSDVDPSNQTWRGADIEAMIQRNLFNKEGKLAEEKALSKDPDPIPQAPEQGLARTNLPLKLWGAVYGGNPFTGIALIENTKAKLHDSFFPNDNIMARVNLLEVHPKYIVIENDGTKEYVPLEEPEKVQAGRQRKKGLPKKQFKKKNQIDGYSEEGFERIGNKIQISSDFRKKMLTTNFAKMLQDAKAEPHSVAGELQGFRLTRIRPGSIYEKSGLQDDDIIKEINGVPLVDTGQAISLLTSLKNANRVEVRFDRSGQEQSIELNVQ